MLELSCLSLDDVMNTPDPNQKFHGLLHSLFYQLQELGNLTKIHEEINFFYSSISPDSNPFDIIAQESDTIGYRSGIEKPGNYFGFTFNKRFVKPYAFVIKSEGKSESDFLASFAIQAFDEDLNEWVTIEEQRNIQNLSKMNAVCVLPVCVNKYYSSFKIVQTDVSYMLRYIFSIAGLEIHGEIKNRDDIAKKPK